MIKSPQDIATCLDALQNMANVGCGITIHQKAYDDKRKKTPMFFARIGKADISPVLDYPNLNIFLLGFRRAVEMGTTETATTTHGGR